MKAISMKKTIDRTLAAGIIFSILIAVIMVLIGQDTALSVMIGLLVTILTFLFDISRSLKFNEQLLSEILKLSDDQWMYNSVRSITTNYRKIHSEIRDEFFLERTKNVLNECTRSMSELSKGRITLKEPSDAVIVNDLIIRARHQAKAVSYNVNFEKWWNNESGKKYLQEHKILIQKGVKVIRVFVIPRGKENEVEEIIKIQRSLGIDVWLTFEENQPVELLESYLIIDDSIVAKSQLTLGGRSRGTYITVDEDDVKNMLRNFDWLLRNARRADEVFAS